MRAQTADLTVQASDNGGKRRKSMNEVKLRRFMNLLVVSGTGVIIFGAWSVLKTILVFLMQKDMIEAIFTKLSVTTTVKVITIIIVVSIMVIDFLIRLFVGRSARAEGFGQKKGYAYIIFAVLLAIGSVSSLVLLFSDAESLKLDSILQTVVSLIVETTSIIVTVELLVAAFTVKKLQKETGEVK